jgi:NADH-quinone oxidoreductase subunit M
MLMRACVVVGAVGLALAAAYALRVARIVWAGEGSENATGAAAEPVRDSRGARWVVVVSLVVAMVVFGVLPQLLLGVSNAAAAELISGLGAP